MTIDLILEQMLAFLCEAADDPDSISDNDPRWEAVAAWWEAYKENTGDHAS